MKLSIVDVGEYQACCYIVKDEENGKSFIVDPGFFCYELEKAIKTIGIDKFDYILLTHGHMDHICGASYIKEKYSGKIVISEKEAFLLKEYRFVARVPEYEKAFRPCEADIVLTNENSIPFGDKEISVLYTPGHTPGSVCYIFENLLFSGDLLFKNSIGNYSFEGGNIFHLLHSLKTVKNLAVDYTVLPGHGTKTTIFEEKSNNPYLRNL